jgi:hypothetical protein
MGSNFATELADGTLGTISLEDQLAMHLTGNHYPPIPRVMVKPCIDAIEAYWEDDLNREIALPIDGVDRNGEPFQIRWKNGNDTAPAWALIEHAHLDAWITDYNDYEEEE